MGEVIKFYCNDAAKNPDAVLEQAIGQYDCIFMIGLNKDGSIDPRASLNMGDEQLLYLIESFKFRLLRGDYHE